MSTADQKVFSPYRKLIAAIIGILLIQLNHRVGLDLTGLESVIVDVAVDVVVSLATAYAIWRVPNNPKS